MVQAQWDNMIWWMSSESIRSLGEVSSSMELDIEKTEDDDGNIKSQAVRMKLEDVEIRYDVARVGGVDPSTEYEGWYWRMRSGVHAPLYFNGKQWMGKEYMLIKVDYESEVIDSHGVMQSATIVVTLREYRTTGQYLDDLSNYVNPTPGIRDYHGSERESALRVTATQMAKQRGQTL